MTHVIQALRVQAPEGFALFLVSFLLIFAAAGGIVALLLRGKRAVSLILAALSVCLALLSLLLCLRGEESDYADPAAKPDQAAESAAPAEETKPTARPRPTAKPDPEPRPEPTPEPTPELVPEGDPQEAAQAFLEGLLTQNEEAARALLLEDRPLGLSSLPESEAGARLLQAMLDSQQLELAGECRTEGLTAIQPLAIRYLDLSAMQAELAAQTGAVLQRYCHERPRQELAEEDGSFRLEARYEAYLEALRSLLSDPGRYVRAEEPELTLRYTPEGWRVEDCLPLLSALGGNAVSGEEILSGALPRDPDGFAARSLYAATDGLIYERTVYTLPEDLLIGPDFDRSRYVHTKDPAVVQEIVDSAAVLLDGQELCWNPGIQFMESSELVCYYDETILVICWKEVVNDCCLSFCEVKIAHGSQLRRCLVGDEYSRGPGPRLTETELAGRVNAVASINGDFYDYRDMGITVYQRQLYRCNPALIDSCFFTASGDMLFAHRGELSEEGEAERFVKDNDVVFALAFGPILVENYEATHTDYYPVGEVNGYYSRAAIGQFDSLHYLLMTCGFGDWYGNVPNINETAQYIQAMGVEKAYALDGGGTAEIVVDGRSYNYVDFDTERPVSDIVCFFSALPVE